MANDLNSLMKFFIFYNYLSFSLVNRKIPGTVSAFDGREHFLYCTVNPDENRTSDDRVANAHFINIFNFTEYLHVEIVQTMPRVDAKAQFLCLFGSLPNFLKFIELFFLGHGVREDAGMNFNEV
jgi:hypothetical protein